MSHEQTPNVDTSGVHPVDARAGTISPRDFYSHDRRRATSPTLSYGSHWYREGWSDDPNHVIELYWLGGTHELTAFYVHYDWSRVDPHELTVSASEVLDAEFGSGTEVGHVLRVLDETTDEVHVEVLAIVHSDLACHELMFGWQWLQHHRDGLTHIRRRIAERQLAPRG
jgi:hypothetical protein